MRGRYLLDRFHEHTDRLAAERGIVRILGPDEPPVTLYGTDEFRLDRKRGAVLLPGVGWIACPDAAGHKGTVEWVGVEKDAGGWSLILGQGDPFAMGKPAVPHALAEEFDLDAIMLEAELDG